VYTAIGLEIENFNQKKTIKMRFNGLTRGLRGNYLTGWKQVKNGKNTRY
jgi:hypothetical protein